MNKTWVILSDLKLWEQDIKILVTNQKGINLYCLWWNISNLFIFEVFTFKFFLSLTWGSFLVNQVTRWLLMYYSHWSRSLICGCRGSTACCFPFTPRDATTHLSSFHTIKFPSNSHKGQTTTCLSSLVHSTANIFASNPYNPYTPCLLVSWRERKSLNEQLISASNFLWYFPICLNMRNTAPHAP